jgi:hypothetical protein
MHLCLAGLRFRWFDPIAESPELSDHSYGALLLGLFGDGWTPFFVTDSLVQDQPDQSTLSMRDGPDGLIVSQSRDRAAIHDLEDASFGLYCGVGGLVEKAPHVAVALRRPVAVVHACAFLVAGQVPAHEESCSAEGKVAAVAPTSAMICCAESTARPGTSASRSTAS